MEAADEGTDTALNNSSTDLPAGFESIENLILIQDKNIDGFGNKLDNLITGNIGDNTLFGDLGNDTLIGGLGNDTLRGGLGNDVMTGGKGDDRYEDTDFGDKILENANEGIDTVATFRGSFTLGANFDNLEFCRPGRRRRRHRQCHQQPYRRQRHRQQAGRTGGNNH